MKVGKMETWKIAFQTDEIDVDRELSSNWEQKVRYVGVEVWKGR